MATIEKTWASSKITLTMRRFHFDVTDSTNLQARELADAYPGQRLLVTATEQTAGRGRRGRRWQSPRGGAWMTLVWPMRLAPTAYRSASLAVAVGVRRGVLELCLQGVPPEAAGDLNGLLVKWPNDLLIDDAKVAGILCEQRLTGAANAAAIVIGIGVNVEFDPALLEASPDGEPLRHRATTLVAATGRRLSAADVVEAVSRRVVEAMEQLENDGFDGPAADATRRPLLAELRDCLAYVGTRRRWLSPGGELCGRVLGVDDQGRLLLEANSKIIACDAGELSNLAP